MKKIHGLLVLFTLIASLVSCSPAKTVTGIEQVRSIITSTKWIHIKTIDLLTKEDISAKYPQFAGIGQYNADGSYEFFTAGNIPKGDRGTWSMTDKNTMKITSATFGYTVSPQIVRSDKDHLDFRIILKDSTGKTTGDVAAMHIPYKEK